MFSNLQNTPLFPLTGTEVVTNILVALLCGLCITWVYRHSYKGPGYSLSFVNSLVFLSMITSIVILTIGSNLARAFGLVGAMSVIRFRTAVKDTQDTVYIFFSLAVGMAAGVGYYQVAFIGTVLVGAIIYLFSKTKAASPHREEYLLQLSYSPNGEDIPEYLAVLQKYCRRHKVVNTRSLGAEREALEVSYYVRLRDKEGNSHFVRELRSTAGVSQVNLYCDEEQI